MVAVGVGGEIGGGGPGLISPVNCDGFFEPSERVPRASEIKCAIKFYMYYLLFVSRVTSWSCQFVGCGGWTQSLSLWNLTIGQRSLCIHAQLAYLSDIFSRNSFTNRFTLRNMFLGVLNMQSEQKMFSLTLAWVRTPWRTASGSSPPPAPLCKSGLRLKFFFQLSVNYNKKFSSF